MTTNWCNNCGNTGYCYETDFVPYGDTMVPMEQRFYCDCSKGLAAEFEDLLRRGHSRDEAAEIVDLRLDDYEEID